MRWFILIILLLAAPAWGQSYIVSYNGQLDNGQSSSFDHVDFPSSHFTPYAQESEQGGFVSQSTFGLKNIDEKSRMRVEETLSDLETRLEEGRLIVTLPGDVLFDFDKFDIRRDAQPVLTRFVTALQAMGNISLTIVGHTDSKGSADYNQALSQRRAISVMNWLAGAGVGVPMLTQGKGKSEPVAPNQLSNGLDNPAGRQKNRRVEFVIEEN